MTDPTDEESRDLHPPNTDIINTVFTLKSLRANIRQRWKSIDLENGIEEPLQIHSEAMSSRPPSNQNPKKRIIREPSVVYDFRFDDHFWKAIESVDANIRGRVITALGVISRKPEVLQGDTVKPLTGNMKGLWRYRIGDYRLVYRFDPDNQRVILTDFASRGSIYD